MLLLSTTIQAEQIYKCIDSNGNIAFQKAPCTIEQGSIELLDIDNEAKADYVPTAPKYSFSEDDKVEEKSDVQKSRERLDIKLEIAMCSNARKNLATEIASRDRNYMINGRGSMTSQFYERMVGMAEIKVAKYC